MIKYFYFFMSEFKFFLSAGDHSVFLDSKKWLIKKTQRRSWISFSEAQESISFFKTHFPTTYVPTLVEEIISWRYSVVQRYVEGDSLSDKDKWELSYDVLCELLQFVEISLSLLLKEWKYFDIVGNQWKTYEETKSQLSLFQKMMEKVIPLAHYNLIKDIFASTNFMITNRGKLLFVDNIVSHGIYNLPFFERMKKVKKIVYRFFILRWYKKQVLNVLKERGVFK